MPSIGPMELVVVLIIALVVFGPKRLPDMGRAAGQGLREFKGALGRAEPHHGALARFEGEFLTFTGGLATSPEAVEAIVPRAREVVEALAPYGSGRNYLNFVEREADTRSFYPAATHDRLRRIRAEVDPHRVFHANHEIPLED